MNGFKQPPNFGQYSEIGYLKKLFFTDELLQETVTEINRYAEDKVNKMRHLPKKVIWWTWKEANLLELKGVLLGIQLLYYKYGHAIKT